MSSPIQNVLETHLKEARCVIWCQSGLTLTCEAHYSDVGKPGLTVFNRER